MAKAGPAGGAGRWGDDAWEEQNWDAVRKQEQMKQDVLIKASGNSERIRQMVRETEVTRSIGSETLHTLDQQSGEALLEFILACSGQVFEPSEGTRVAPPFVESWSGCMFC